MPKPGDRSSWPGVFLDVVEAARAGQGLTIELPARNLAVNLRHRWHAFRQELLRERHPDAPALLNIVCSVRPSESMNGKDGWELVWSYVAGLRGSAPSMGDVPASAASQGILREQAESRPVECAHQPNEWGICTLCGEAGVPPGRSGSGSGSGIA